MTARRYAEKTTVPVERSMAEIKTMLKRSGADQIATFEGKEGTKLMFQLGVGQYRLSVPIKQGVKDPDQEERRSWRLMVLLVKAKLEAVREGATTVEREFFADRLLYNGMTVDETIGPELRLAHEEGRMPKQLMLGGPK